MSHFIEALDLLHLATISGVLVSADQTLEEVLGEEPWRLLDIGEPSREPVSLPAYRVRLARSNEGEGPVTYGLANFVACLEALDEDASAVVVTGETSTYILLLDAGRTRVIATTAIDPPPSSCGPAEAYDYGDGSESDG